MKTINILRQKKESIRKKMAWQRKKENPDMEKYEELKLRMNIINQAIANEQNKKLMLVF